MAINGCGSMGNHSNGNDGGAVGILRNVMWWASSLHYFLPLLLSIMGAEIKCKYQSL